MNMNCFKEHCLTDLYTMHKLFDSMQWQVDNREERAEVCKTLRAIEEELSARGEDGFYPAPRGLTGKDKPHKENKLINFPPLG